MRGDRRARRPIMRLTRVGRVALPLAFAALALGGSPALAGVTTSRASMATDGTQGNDDSYIVVGALATPGRFVAFSSYASNLVANDANGFEDVFVRDLRAGTTTLVSVNGAGAPGNGNSAYPV